MIRQSVTAVALLLLAIAPLAAQGGMNHDPDHAAGGGALPAGWSARKDNPNAPDAMVMQEGKAIHVTSGAAAIYWMEKQSPTVPYTLSATFTQLKAPSHPEAYGLFFMGSRLDAPEQTYAYLLVRGDGMVMVRHRAGTEVHKVKDLPDNAAVHKADASGRATNTLSVVAGTDSTRMFVNGTEVAALAADYAKAAGHVGIRVNHNLDVRVDDYSLKSGPATTHPASKAAAKRTVATKG